MCSPVDTSVHQPWSAGRFSQSIASRILSHRILTPLPLSLFSRPRPQHQLRAGPLTACIKPSSKSDKFNCAFVQQASALSAALMVRFPPRCRTLRTPPYARILRSPCCFGWYNSPRRRPHRLPWGSLVANAPCQSHATWALEHIANHTVGCGRMRYPPADARLARGGAGTWHATRGTPGGYRPYRKIMSDAVWRKSTGRQPTT